MIPPSRTWPPYATPGCLALYAGGLIAWIAIFSLGGRCAVMVVLAVGAWLGLVIGVWLNRFPGGDG